MKNGLTLIILLSILWSCQEEKSQKSKVPYKEGDTYEWNGRKYNMKGWEYYPDGTDKFLVLGFDSSGKKYERHLSFHENGKNRRIRLINPEVDTLQYPKKYNQKKSLIYYVFMGYILKEETFYENGNIKAITIRNSQISDSSYNFSSYDENKKLKKISKDRKVNDMWILEEEKDGKITIDTFYFWK